MILIPAIDIRGGRCVRLYRGDFAAETHYDVEPHELLERYRELGARWLHVVDLDGARDGVLANRSTILALAMQNGMNLQVGGGVRSAAVIEDLLNHGVDRVVIGSAAIDSPDAAEAWLACYGAARVVLACDVSIRAHRDPEVMTRGWTRASGQSLWEITERLSGCGLRHVLCTDIDRDGALNGPNLELYSEAVERFPQIAWQASGGVRNAADLAELARLGVGAAVCGRALLEARMSAKELQPFWPDASFPASTSATAR